MTNQAVDTVMAIFRESQFPRYEVTQGDIADEPNMVVWAPSIKSAATFYFMSLAGSSFYRDFHLPLVEKYGVDETREIMEAGCLVFDCANNVCHNVALPYGSPIDGALLCVGPALTCDRPKDPPSSP